MSYVAAKQVAIGYDQEDPENPGAKLVRVYEPGEQVDVTGIENLDAMVFQGYLKEEGDDE